MPDQIKQLAFKEFSITELRNGTAANVLTTNASTHHVIKSIEATQGNNDDAINATATIGLTAGLASEQFTSVGNVAKKDRVGLSGSVIMDASSTLTVRPTAKTITFTDERITQGIQNTGSNRQYLTAIKPDVNGNLEPTLNTETLVDRTSVTYNGTAGYDTMTNSAASGNFVVEHTNANGVTLRILFRNGGTSGTSFAVWNATDGTYYGYYNNSYDRPLYDGERYIFWLYTGGASSMRVRWYDLDESTTNLAAANTTGGGNGGNFYHGQSAILADSPNFASRSTYDNHFNAYYKNRHTDNRRYLVGISDSGYRMWGVELPTTLTNDSSTTPAPKWLGLSPTSGTSGGTEPFGAHTSGWNWTNLRSNVSPSAYGQMSLTYDKDKERYYIWISPQNHRYFLFTFTQTEWDNRSSGNLLDPAGNNHGLILVSHNSFSDVGLDSNVFVNYSSNNGQLNLTNEVYTRAGSALQPVNNSGAVYIDATTFYYKNFTGSQPTTHKCIKMNMADVSKANIVDLFPNSTVSGAGYSPDLFVSFGSPTSTQISSRNYLNAPGLKVRVTGIDVDQ